VIRKAPGRLSPDLIDDLVDAGSREHYADAALYDYEYRRRRADVTFYRELARRRAEKMPAGEGRHRDHPPHRAARLRAAAAEDGVAERGLRRGVRV